MLAGEIRAAVSKLSDVDATLLRDIGFHMQKQALLEIIRKGSNAAESLKYAQVQVAPLAKDSPEFVQELESVMSLLLYADASKSPEAHFLSDEQRERTANIANAALLHYAKLSDKPKLERIMKAVCWAQKTALESGIKIPRLMDLRTLEFYEPTETMDSDNPLLLSDDGAENEFEDDDDDEEEEDDDDDDDDDDDEEEEGLADYEEEEEEEVFAAAEEE